METDSFIVNIKTEDLSADLAKGVNKRFDTSSYEADRHCVKGVRIRSVFCPYFPAFGLNTEIFNPNTGKYGPEKPRIRTLFTQFDLYKKE